MVTETTAWNHFSKYIRTRDCLKTTGNREYGKCYTCGVIKPFANLDAGHFVKSTHKDIKFDERNVHAQCVQCNHHLGGNEAVYTLKMVDEYGRETVDYLMSRKHIPKVHDFDKLSAEYREKLKNVENPLEI